jgi:nucleotide-binding universal stress UspA family protein
MKVLLAIDGSRYALAATRFLCEYLAHARRHVDILHVLPLVVQAGAVPPRRQPENIRVPAVIRSWLDRAEKRLRARGFTTATHVQRGVPAQVVTSMAAKGGYDLVVLGAKGRNDIPFLPLGSVALSVLEYQTPANVLLVRERELQKKQQIPTAERPFPALFATDGSKRLEMAAHRFFQWFTVPRLQPVGVAVAELPEPAALAAMDTDERAQVVRHIKDAAGRWAREAKPLLVRPGIRAQARVLSGRAAAAIVEEADRCGARLVVLGSRGVASPSEPPLGSTALQVAHRAPCSVFIVRGR